MEYFLLFLIWIAAALVFPRILRRFNIPWVTAVIFAGILLGPYGLGFVQPGEIMSFLSTNEIFKTMPRLLDSIATHIL